MSTIWTNFSPFLRPPSGCSDRFGPAILVGDWGGGVTLSHLFKSIFSHILYVLLNKILMITYWSYYTKPFTLVLAFCTHTRFRGPPLQLPTIVTSRKLLT